LRYQTASYIGRTLKTTRIAVRGCTPVVVSFTCCFLKQNSLRRKSIYEKKYRRKLSWRKK
jgi:hypothetical protein